MNFHIQYWSRQILTRLSSLLPSCCLLCGRDGDEAVCTDCCYPLFQHTTQHRCIQCAIRLPHSKTDTADPSPYCGQCLRHPPAFDATIVATDYVPPIDHLVLALKFGSRLALAPLFARTLRDALLQPDTPSLPLPCHITAVPLGPKRLAERGFNQAVEIAKPLSRTLGIPLNARMITRVRDTQAQALLHPRARHKNIRHAFLVTSDAIDQISGKHIGVVDDVMTTGETLSELAATLKRFGATRVTNFVFARTHL